MKTKNKGIIKNKNKKQGVRTENRKKSERVA